MSARAGGVPMLQLVGAELGPAGWWPLVAAARRRAAADPAADPERSARPAIEPLAGGMNNRVYVGERPDGRGRCCVKIYRVDDDRRRAEREWLTLRLLAGYVPGLAPYPLACAPDERQPAVIMEYLPGRPLTEGSLGEGELAALATTLARLHAIVPGVATYPSPIVATPAGQIRRLRGWAATLDPGGRDPHADTILALLRPWLAGPDPATLALAAPAVFGRGDPNLANCLWDGRRVRCVDFEYAGWSDEPFELANLVEGVWAHRTPPADWDGFLARFEAARRLCALLWILLLRDRDRRRSTGESRVALEAQIDRARARLGQPIAEKECP